jgi:hypothetical protein
MHKYLISHVNLARVPDGDFFLKYKGVLCIFVL